MKVKYTFYPLVLLFTVASMGMAGSGLRRLSSGFKPGGALRAPTPPRIVSPKPFATEQPVARPKPAPKSLPPIPPRPVAPKPLPRLPQVTPARPFAPLLPPARPRAGLDSKSLPPLPPQPTRPVIATARNINITPSGALLIQPSSPIGTPTSSPRSSLILPTPLTMAPPVPPRPLIRPSGPLLPAAPSIPAGAPKLPPPPGFISTQPARSTPTTALAEPTRPAPKPPMPTRLAPAVPAGPTRPAPRPPVASIQNTTQLPSSVVQAPAPAATSQRSRGGSFLAQQLAARRGALGEKTSTPTTANQSVSLSSIRPANVAVSPQGIPTAPMAPPIAPPAPALVRPQGLVKPTAATLQGVQLRRIDTPTPTPSTPGQSQPSTGFNTNLLGKVQQESAPKSSANIFEQDFGE